MNNRELNREFMKRTKEKPKPIVSDSDEEDDSAQKSSRSSVSGKSSLLSARSSKADDFSPSSKKNMLGTLHQSRKRSPEANDLISPRRPRSINDKSFSPQSSRSSERSEGISLSNHANPLKQMNNLRLDNRELNMTLKKPLNDTLGKSGQKLWRETTRDRDLDEILDSNNRNRDRPTTPGSLSKLITQNRPQQRRTTSNQMYNENENDIEEEDEEEKSWNNSKLKFMDADSAKARRRSNSNQSPLLKDSNRRASFGKKDSPLRDSIDDDSSHLDSLIKSKGSFESRRSPEKANQYIHDDDELEDESELQFSRDNKEDDKEKELYKKHTKTIEKLLNPKSGENSFAEELEQVSNEKKVVEKRPSVEKTEKDPQVTETIEDTKITEKLQKERELKKQERENRAKKQTETTKRIEEAIEKVENTMQDTMRMSNLKEKSELLNYSTKPAFNETTTIKHRQDTQPTNQQEVNNRRRRTRSMSATNRSLSASGLFELSMNKKYAHIKPKTQTRVPLNSARAACDDLNESRQDVLNDSSCLRQTIYNEWYYKKIQQAKQQLKEAQLAKKDDEEKKAQELIEKLQKSNIVYKMWNEKKKETLRERQRSAREFEKLIAKKQEDKKEKQEGAKTAFDRWLKDKIEAMREQKEKELDTKRDEEKKKRLKQQESEEKKHKKPPVPYEAWKKRKEDELSHRLLSASEKKKQKEQENQEKQKKKQLAKLSYLEWLDKKEQDQQLNQSTNLNKSLSASMSSLPPFYPASKTIPFGR